MKDTPKTKLWINYCFADAPVSLRLFCFPYAGGLASMFADWPKRLPMSIDVCAIQYPGRGTRSREAPVDRISILAAQIGEELASLSHIPFALFGHSMGAQVAFEVARLLDRHNQTPPQALFVSACPSPPDRVTDRATYDLPDLEFIENLRQMKGAPGEALSNLELMQLMLPSLRAEFAASQTYTYLPGPPLSCPIIAFGGMDDDLVTGESLETWRNHTAAGFSLRMIPGDHFFIYSSAALLMRLITQELRMIQDSGY